MFAINFVSFKTTASQLVMTVEYLPAQVNYSFGIGFRAVTVTGEQ